MSVGSSSLGRRVLVLTTDATQLRQGLSQARALTMQQTADMKRAARVQLEADLLKLRADFRQAERDANAAKRQIEIQTRYKASIDLADYRAGLREAARLKAAADREMQRQAGGSGALGQFGGAVLQGLGIGTGFGLVTQGVGLAVSGVGAVAGAMKDGATIAVQYNAAIEQSEARLRGYGLTAAQIAQTQAIANKAVMDGRGTYRDTLAALADLTPLARTYKVRLDELLHTTQLLAATDPAQGFEGASIAIREALSGDFTSLQRRFEIPRAEIQKLKDEGVPNLEIVIRTLDKLGINDNLLAQQANTFTQRLAILKDEAARLLSEGFGPLNDFGADAFKGLTDFLHDPATKQAVKEFASDLSKGLADLRAFGADPESRQALRDLIVLTGRVSGGLLTMASAVSGKLTPAFHYWTVGLYAAADAYNALNREADRFRFVGPKTTDGQIGSELSVPNVAGYQPKRMGDGPQPIGTAAVAPESETQFGIAASDQIARQWAAQLAQARSDLRAFAADWASEDFDLFSKLAPQVRSAFDNIFGGLDIQQQFERGLGSLDALTGRMVEDIQNTGRVSRETADLITGTLGEEAGRSVLQLADQYATLAAATDRLKGATDELEAAQAALSGAQQAANRHAEESREIVDGLQRSLSALSREASDAAQGYADRLAALRDERDAADALAEAHRRQFQAQIDGLESVKRAREKAEAVRNLTAEQDATLLSYEQRIRAARRGGDERGARALEAERDRFLARSRYAIDLAALEAKVAQNAADKESAAIQKHADETAAKDKAAQEAIDARIAALQDEAEQVARDYAARERAIRDQIDAENERARVVAAADKRAIDDAQTRVDSANAAKRAAQDEATAAAAKATAMANQTTELDKQIKAQKDFIDYLRSLGIDVAKYYNGTGTTGVGLPVPGNGAGGGTRGPGTPEALRIAPSYVPPTPPPAAAASWGGLRGGGGGAMLRAGGSVTIQGPFVSYPNATIRESVEVEAAAERGATLALQRLSDALGDDERSGGNISWGA